MYFQRFKNINLNEEAESYVDDDTSEIYTKYNFAQPTSVYPITHYQTRILKAIKENAFVVLEGPTACGKTTQVPQFILNDAYNQNEYCNIIIAQPRRIAAASNAERVASERNWPLGTVVGYQVGYDEKKHLSADTRVLFCTTGILLEKLIRAKHFHRYTHIILDEVHERNKDMDFLFIVIKKLFTSVEPRPKVKIIIMSATIEASRVSFIQHNFLFSKFLVEWIIIKRIFTSKNYFQFSEYFAFPRCGILEAAPIITVEHKSNYQVKKTYLEEFYKVAPRMVRY